MRNLSAKQREELEAIKLTTGALGKPTYLWASLAKTDRTLASLIKHKFITWKYPSKESGWSRAFRAVELTERGRAAIFRITPEAKP